MSRIDDASLALLNEETVSVPCANRSCPHDPRRSVVIHATYDSPLQIRAFFQYQKPGETTLTTFVSVDVSDDVPKQDLTTTIAPLPSGTTLLLTSSFAGAQHTAYRFTITLLQDGVRLCEPIECRGGTKDALSAIEECRVTLL